MQVAVRLNGEVSYIQFIGIVSLLRTYPKVHALCHEAKGKWFDALKKMKGMSFLMLNYEPPVPDNTFVVPTNSLTFGRWIDMPKHERVMNEGHLLFTSQEDVFTTKDITHIQNIPSDNDVNPKYIATSNSHYAKIVRQILPERTWNFYNEAVVGESMERPLPVRKMDKKFRFHLIGLHHLPTSEEYMSCAFTQKNVKMCKMLLDLGHEVYLYGAEGSDAPCTKFIETHTLSDIRQEWGDGDNRFNIGYNWHETQFRHDINKPASAVTKKARANIIKAILENKEPGDFLLVTQGTYQKEIADAVGLFLTVEPGIGYRGSYAKYRSFESTYIQYFTYGSEKPRQSINGNNYDRVIPNYFDEKDFPFESQKEDYYLFMGRLIQRKGLEIAIKAVEHLGGKLIVAGQKDDETKHLMNSPVIEYVGYADVHKRAKLMGRARAVFTPSTYLEPFCGVHAEAMLCGTPVITTNFGAFTDYVIDGLNGYKCNTLQDFVDAGKAVENLNPQVIRKYASKFTLDSVKWSYQRWFQDLYRVYESTVDKTKKAWHHLE